VFLQHVHARTRDGLIERERFHGFERIVKFAQHEFPYLVRKSKNFSNLQFEEIVRTISDRNRASGVSDIGLRGLSFTQVL